MPDLSKPTPPEIPSQPKPEVYGVNAPGLDPQERAVRTARWQRAVKDWETTRQSQMTTYLEAQRNYQIRMEQVRKKEEAEEYQRKVEAGEVDLPMTVTRETVEAQKFGIQVTPTGAYRYEYAPSGKVIESSLRPIVSAPPSKEITPSPQALEPPSISAYKEPTAEEKKTTKFYSEMYGEQDFISKGFGTISTSFGEMFGGFATFFGGGRRRIEGPDPFSFKPSPTLGVGGTMIYTPTLETYPSEELFEQVKFKQAIVEERERVESIISPGGITMEEAAWGTLQLETFYKTKLGEFKVGAEERAKAREIERKKEAKPIRFAVSEWFKSVTPEWGFKPYEFERKTWEKLGGGEITTMGVALPREITTKVLTIGGTFVSGAYMGIREKPLETWGTLVAIASISAATAGLGTVPSLAAYATKIGYGLKVAQYGIGGLYGASVVARVGAIPGDYEKIGKAGEIFGTEILPMFVGYKIGKKVGFRIQREAAYYSTVKGLETQYGVGSTQVKEFKTEWDIAFKQLGRYTAPQKAWTAKDVEAITGSKKAIEITNVWARKHGIKIIGSSVITPQTTLTKPPRGFAGDIDIQQIGLTRWGTKKAALELFTSLKKGGIKDVRWDISEFAGKPKYHITIGGKEFANIGVSSSFYYGQIEPTLNLFDIKRLAYVKDPYGVQIASLRDQMRVKIWKGYVEGARPKDIVDVKGIAAAYRPTVTPDYFKFTGQAPQLFGFGIIEQPVSFRTKDIGVSSYGITPRPSRFTYTPSQYYPTPPFIYTPLRKPTDTYFLPSKIYTPTYRPPKTTPTPYREPPYRGIFPFRFVPPRYTPPPYKPTPPPPFIFTPPPTDLFGGRRKQERILLKFDFKPGLGVKRRFEAPKKPYFYQPSLAALGLKGTKYAQPILKKVPKLAATGLFTRFEVPTYRIKRIGGIK